ncbi:hypothetical protein [Nocardia gipuzkoensis]
MTVSVSWTDCLTVDPPRLFRIRYDDGTQVSAEVIGARIVHDEPARAATYPTRPPRVLEYCVLFGDRHTQGVRHMFGALDLRSGQLYYRIRDRKR